MITDQRVDDFIVGTAEPDIKAISNFLNALRTLDLPDLIKKGVLPKENTEAHLFELLSESNPSAFFRKHKSASEILTDLWVSKIFQRARSFFLQNSELAFVKNDINNQYLSDIAKLSVDEKSICNLDRILYKKGIIFLIEPYIPGSKVDGVSLKLPNGVPVIGLSLRHTRLDNFWFTLLHELAHIHLHYDELDKPIIDDLDIPAESKIEKQANLTAKHSILSKQLFRTVDIQEIRKKSYLTELSRQAGVHPALIAGLFRFELNNYTLHSEIINKINVKSILDGTL